MPGARHVPSARKEGKCGCVKLDFSADMALTEQFASALKAAIRSGDFQIGEVLARWGGMPRADREH